MLCHTRSWPASQHRSSIIAPGPTSKPPRSDDPSFVSVPTFQDSDLTFLTPHLSFGSSQTIRFSADLLGRLLFPIIAQQAGCLLEAVPPGHPIHLERPARTWLPDTAYIIVLTPAPRTSHNRRHCLWTHTVRCIVDWKTQRDLNLPAATFSQRPLTHSSRRVLETLLRAFRLLSLA